jgi:hypothetical protein
VNEFAFPHVNFVGQKISGMTLRDYFAGQAMQALITRETKMIPDPSVYAGAAYDLADAMLEASKNEIRNP